MKITNKEINQISIKSHPQHLDQNTQTRQPVPIEKPRLPSRSCTTASTSIASAAQEKLVFLIEDGGRKDDRPFTFPRWAAAGVSALFWISAARGWLLRARGAWGKYAMLACTTDRWTDGEALRMRETLWAVVRTCSCIDR